MGSSTEMEFGTPASMEEAEARLQEIKYIKKDLSLQKKEVMEAQRIRREQYTEATRKRATRGKGLVSAVIPSVGKTSKKTASLQDSYGRKSLAKDLEPLEEERAAIEAEMLALDREKLELERWIAQEEAKEKAEKERHEQHLDALDSMKEDGLLSEEEYEAGVERVQDQYEEEE